MELCSAPKHVETSRGNPKTWNSNETKTWNLTNFTSSTCVVFFTPPEGTLWLEPEQTLAWNQGAIALRHLRKEKPHWKASIRIYSWNLILYEFILKICNVCWRRRRYKTHHVWFSLILFYVVCTDDGYSCSLLVECRFCAKVCCYNPFGHDLLFWLFQVYAKLAYSKIFSLSTLYFCTIL